MDRENKNCREADCPFYKFCLEDLDALQKASLDLIKRQRVENKELIEDNANLNETIVNLLEQIKTIKSEVIKEFAERLKGKLCNDFGFMVAGASDIDIDNLVKEMGR